MAEEYKPILCLDFDGVLHSYTSGWQGADVVTDPPVEGALVFLVNASKVFNINIFSSRSNQSGGVAAMQKWLANWFMDDLEWSRVDADEFVSGRIFWARDKPPALVTIDDRAICFDGTWPGLDALLAFKPWNKRAE